MSWISSTINDLCLMVTDGAHHSPKEVSDGYPMASSKDMLENDFDLSNIKNISEDEYIKLVNGNCKPLIGDVLLIKDGNSYLKKIFAIKEEREMVVLSSIAILRPNITKIDPLFFQYALRNPDTKKFMENFVSGSAIPRIVLKDFKSMKIAIPILTTQIRIAGILSSYDDLLENNLKRIKLLEETAQNIYKEWFVNFRFPNFEHTEFDKESGLPMGWETGSFYDFVDIMSGGTPKTNVVEYYDGNIPFYTPKDASSNSFLYINRTEKNITEIGLQKCNSKLYPQNTVFITARGTVGKVNLAMRSMAMNQSCYALKLKNGGSPFFLLATTLEAVEIIKKTATGGVFDTIIVDTFKRIPIVFPDQKSITNYHNFVEPIFLQTIKIQEQVSLLKEARDILLPRLMNRTIEV